MHLESARRERQGDAPRPDRQLEHGPVTRKLRQCGDGRGRVERGVLLVVDVGDVLAVGRGVVALQRVLLPAVERGI